MSHGGYSWKATTNHSSRMLCHRGVVAGTDTGSDVYVGRSMYKGDVLPAKVIPNKNAAYICYDGAEIPVTNFEV